MTIAIDIRSITASNPSGVGHAVCAWLFALQRLEHDHTFLLFTTGRTPAQLPEPLASDPRFTLVQPKGPSKFWNLGIALGAVSLERILGRSVDAVWYPNTGFLPKTNARTVLTVHDLAFHLMPDTYTRIDHLRYRITRARTWITQADTCLAVSESTARDVAHAFGRTSTVTPLGIDTNLFSPRKEPSDLTDLANIGIGGPYLVSLTTREPRKNLETLIDAFEILKRADPELQLVLAGGRGWKSRRLTRRITQSPQRTSIHVLGYVDDAIRAKLLRNARALVLPSRYEGFGMQILEAFAVATPVVCAQNSSLLEVVDGAAVSAPAMDPVALAQILQALLSDTKLQTQLSEHGLARANSFSWQQSAQQLLQILTNAQN